MKAKPPLSLGHPQPPEGPAGSGRRVRNILTVFVFALTVAGSVWGQDDHFPFAPFRMYSTTTSPAGTVKMPYFEGTTASGTKVRLETEELGLRTAEVLGQIDRFRRNPALLGHLARNRELGMERGTHLVALRLVQEVHQLKGGRPHTGWKEVVSAWPEP